MSMAIPNYRRVKNSPAVEETPETLKFPFMTIGACLGSAQESPPWNLWCSAPHCSSSLLTEGHISRNSRTKLVSNGFWSIYHMGGCQNYGPLLGPLNTRSHIMQRTQIGTIILTTTHIEILIVYSLWPQCCGSFFKEAVLQIQLAVATALQGIWNLKLTQMPCAPARTVGSRTVLEKSVP